MSFVAPQRFQDRLWFFFCGVCMGAADIVPGVSGGTIAFIMGFYEELIENIKSLTGRRKTNWNFLLPLGFGIILSFAAFSHLVQVLLGHEVWRVFLYAAFVGLILGSVFFCARSVGKWYARYLIATLLGMVAAFFLTGSSANQEFRGRFDVRIDAKYSRKIENYDATRGMLIHVSEKTLAAMLSNHVISEQQKVYDQKTGKEGTVADFVQPHYTVSFDFTLIACGLVAVSAMLLPGISGSYMMVILGMYPVIIGAIADVLHGDRDAFWLLFNFGIGIVIGGLLFARFVSWLLAHYHEWTIALLIGFMLGALRALWPFWSYAYRLNPLKLAQGPQLVVVSPILPSPTDPVFLISLFLALASFFFVLAIESKKRSTS